MDRSRLPAATYFWARGDYNLGYNWYRKDSKSSFAFGVRQAESEESIDEENRGNEDRHQNFALRSARPGTWQLMPVYFYVGRDTGAVTHDRASAFTRGDHFKPVPGFQVMATHFHMGLVRRARQAGGLDAKVSDLEVMKAAGIKIVAPIDGGGYVPGSAGVDDPKWFKWTRGLGAPLGGDIGPTEGAEGQAARARARRVAILSRRWRLITRPHGCNRIKTSWSCRIQRCCAAKSRGRWVDIRTFSFRTRPSGLKGAPRASH